MNEFGCKGFAEDHSTRDESPLGDWAGVSGLQDFFRAGQVAASYSRKPSKTYTQRSTHINNLREQSRHQAANADFDLAAPTKEAVAAAESFLNYLSEGSLDLEIAISHSGEINFFFHAKADLFQVLIDEAGGVSYYGKVAGKKISGSDVSPSKFPYLDLVSFVDQHK